MRSLVFLFGSALFFLPGTSLANHLRGGQIRVIPQDDPLTCVIEVTVYTNIFSDVRFGEGLLDFGDGSTFTTPTVQNTPRPDLFYDVGIVTYSTTHTYASPGTYLVSYLEPNIPTGILNIPNSDGNRFYMETYFVLSSTGSHASPEFPAIPIFHWQSNLAYSFSTAAIDNDSNEFFYKYRLVTDPKQINGFRLPANLKINSNNGLVTWDTEFDGAIVQGQIWIVIKVERYSKEGLFLGYITRPMQIIVEDNSSTLDLVGSFEKTNNKVVVTDGAQKVVTVVMSDAGDFSNVHFELYVSEKIAQNVTLEQYDSLAGKFRIAKLSFNTTSDIVSDLPYPVILRGISFFRKDISFLYMTKDVPLPVVPVIVSGLEGMNLSEPELMVYPNPFHSELYVDGTEAIFINALGNVMMRSPLTKGEPVNTSALPVGFYILQVVDEIGTRKNIRLIRN